MTDVLDYILESERTRRGASRVVPDDELQQLEQEVAEIRKAAPEKAAPNDEFRFRIVSTMEQLAAMAADLDKCGLLTVDVETTGVDVFTDRLVGVGLCGSTAYGYYIPVGHETPGTQLDLAVLLPVLRELFAGKKINAHNAVFEYQVFKQLGITLDIGFDTMTAYQLTDETGKAGLKVVAPKILDVGDWALNLEERPANKRAIREVGIYCCRDCLYTHALYEKLEPIMRAEYSFVFFEVELPLVPVMGEMMLAGVPVEAGYLDELKVKVEAHLQELTDDIHTTVGHKFNINSSQQLADVLYRELKVPVINETKTGKPSTDAETLEKIDAIKFPVVIPLLEYKRYEKIRSSYLEPRINPETGRTHASYRQIGTETGRMAGSGSFHPLTFPKDDVHPFSLRRTVGGIDGLSVICADYSSQEPAGTASYARDPEYAAPFAAGESSHGHVARMMFGLTEGPNEIKEKHPEQYAIAKEINLALVYGMSEFALATKLTEALKRAVSPEEAKPYIEKFFSAFPGVRRWLDSVIAGAKRDGFVEDMAGRRRRLPILKEKCRKGDKEMFWRQKSAEREATNFMVQALAASQTKRAMFRCYRRLAEEHPRVQIIAARHDELMFLVPDDEVDAVCAAIKGAMENDPELEARGLTTRPKVEITVGKSWSKADQHLWKGVSSSTNNEMK